jgi:ketosteroid isomerase-like protein
MTPLFFLLLTASTPEADIRSHFDRLMIADSRGDVDAVLECYAVDAVLLPPGGASVQGLENIRPRYQALFAASRLEVRMEVESIEVNGALAFSRGFTRGRTIPKDGSPPREIADRYLMVLREQPGGGWKIAALMWGPVTADH